MDSTSPTGPPPCPVESWFGSHFASLHPLLQNLHRSGGTLAGRATITYGTGAAGFLGRRLAARLGLPAHTGECDFAVHIGHTDKALIWSRHFTAPDGGTRALTSVFTPHGHYPEGYWDERTGAMRFRLGVRISEDGGWHWQVRRAAIGGLPLPVALFPRSHAYKCVEAGRYRFQVSFVMPGLGTLLSYGGLLQLEPQPDLQACASPADRPRP